MEKFMPYLVLVLVSLLFFFVCWIFFGKAPAKKVEHMAALPSERDARHDKFKEVTRFNEETPGRWEGQSKEFNHKEFDKTVPIPVIKDVEATQIIPSIKEEMVDVVEQVAVAPDAGTAFKPSLSAMPEGDAVDMGLALFTHHYGFVTSSMEALVLEVTREAFTRLGIHTKAEAEKLLSDVSMQEALLSMQKSYVGMETPWMKEIAVTAFVDLVSTEKENTLHLIAYDALRILPQIRLPHLQNLAMLLLLRYSRNSNNYSLENFRHYVEKYVKPFLTQLSMGPEVYSQLDYLRCVLPESEQPSFKELLTDVYPYVFAVEGFTETELEPALRGVSLNRHYVVKSLNSGLFKFAAVDESMMPALFEEAGIRDHHIQDRLLALMVSRSASLAGDVGDGVILGIAKELRTLQEVYDTTQLGRTGLSLLGLYLAKLHVKGQINEDFDISNWI